MKNRLVKICGITNAGDAALALAAKADLIGLVFVPTSKRYLTIENAKNILSALNAADRDRAVGLFQNESIETVVTTVRSLGLKIVQLHGDESPRYLETLIEKLPHCRFIKAVILRQPGDLEKIRPFAQPSLKEKILAILLDGPGGGGSGRAFDWQTIAEALKTMRHELPPIFLAGGLRPENVAEAVSIMNPDGVDVSSGVETGPGKKDEIKIRKFVDQARGCD
jgi:phosphoribosylanthranilate isomerase